MADLFLHLPFARRLRFAEGLHPLAAEAIGRRSSLIVLGASLASLPGSERRGMSWLRRLFSRGGEAARWQKLLAPTPGQPKVDLIAGLLGPEDAAIGPLARFALGIGVLSHEILEDKIGALTASLPAAERAAVERAQARLWLQASVPRQLELEWKPVLDLADADANKRALTQLDRALKRVHGSGPGESALARWLKGLAVEMGPLAEGKGPSGALPPSLSIADHDARGPHFEQPGFVEKTQAALASIVFISNRLAEAFTAHNPSMDVLKAALTKDGKLAEPTSGELEEQKKRWVTWVSGAREEALVRGRNPKPAFSLEGGEVKQPSAEQRLASITKVLNLADLPPEAEAAGAPPIPEMSGPNVAPPPPPAVTQEVSLAQIEAEARAAGFQSPAHTQEVSVAQIEAEQASAEGFQLPAHTQEVNAAQLVDERPSSQITQPISADAIAAANAEDHADRAAKLDSAGTDGALAAGPTAPDGAPTAPPDGAAPTAPAADGAAPTAAEAAEPASVLAPPVGAEGVAASADGGGHAPTPAHTDNGVGTSGNGVTHDVPPPPEPRPEDGPPRE